MKSLDANESNIAKQRQGESNEIKDGEAIELLFIIIMCVLCERDE